RQRGGRRRCRSGPCPHPGRNDDPWRVRGRTQDRGGRRRGACGPRRDVRRGAMRDRLTLGVRALGAATALAVLLVGVPVVLCTAAGWPLPTTIPSWDSIRTALTGASMPDEVIVKAIAVIAWLAWTQVMVSAAVEVVAWIRGRVAPSLPFSGPVQLVVRQL